MALTGNKRSIVLKVTRMIGSVVVAGYPKTYDGKAAFSVADWDYFEITDNQLATMPYDDYLERLEDFKSYVQNLEPGLNVDNVSINNAYIRG